MGQARIRKQKGAYPTQIFELEPQESKRLAELLPPYIIGMKFDPAERRKPRTLGRGKARL